ncbi:histidinol-phosphatase [Candidatus Uhrbacteria bacterium]|nr:histidinol-phosphatase [Candidatus Uhrbacteria bacterium]
MKKQKLVSIHGGHSGEFCNHAEDTLEEVIQTYIAKGFSWVGITDHAPPPDDRFLDAGERKAGQSAQELQERFGRYMQSCRSLQEKYVGRITVLVGFEGEGYTGYKEHTKALLQKYKPDYFIGSVHHVRDEFFDAGEEQYASIASKLGGVVPMYCEYFDTQYSQIEALKPPVIGHFDYIRISDPHYADTLQHPDVKQRIERNLESIRAYGLIMDFNVSPLWGGGTEPFPSGWILKRACELGIRVIPGDDSHGTKTVGLRIEDGIKILKETGFDTDFPVPQFAERY